MVQGVFLEYHGAGCFLEVGIREAEATSKLGQNSLRYPGVGRSNISLVDSLSERSLHSSDVYARVAVLYSRRCCLATVMR